MNTPRSFASRTRLAVFLAAALAVVAMGAFAATPPVTVTLAPNGNAVPGATVTAKATVTINDGSTLQSITWTQVGGPDAALSGTSTDTVTAVLPSRKTFKEALIHALQEPPLPGVPEESYHGGLQDRFDVVGINHHALGEADTVSLKATVKTTSGTYTATTGIGVSIPWGASPGIRNVAINVPVLLHGKTQASYNWTLTPPAGSSATLSDATSQSPDFTPDVPGVYQLTITDLAAGKAVNMTVRAGTWKGIIVGEDANGRPVPDPQCMTCHVQNTPNFDLFTPWKNSGHAEIFTQNVDENFGPGAHYSSACLDCHTVGLNGEAANNGFDDTAGYPGLLASGLISPGGGNEDAWSQILTQFPTTARLANIQCENCHGPQDSTAHMAKDGTRNALSSEVCGSCHGEPTRHGRYQQWQLSGHANYETAVAEGTNPSCAKCHSAQGFIAWEKNNFGPGNVAVTWTADEVHPQTCATCHEPHSVGTTSGADDTNATVRISGNTPALEAGFQATNVGKGAICMTCHNGRRGLHDDAHFSLSDLSRAPHVGPQADIVMGQNLFFAEVGTPGYHAKIEDSCVNCHMDQTDPPAALSNNLGGTNHLFNASTDICAKCHTEITAEQVQGAVEAKMELLKEEIQNALMASMKYQIRSGNAIDLGGQVTVRDASDLVSVDLAESHGRQGLGVTLSDSTVLERSH